MAPKLDFQDNDRVEGGATVEIILLQKQAIAAEKGQNISGLSLSPDGTRQFKRESLDLDGVEIERKGGTSEN